MQPLSEFSPFFYLSLYEEYFEIRYNHQVIVWIPLEARHFEVNPISMFSKK